MLPICPVDTAAAELCCLLLQLEEYKDAFRIFDRHGQGSFTGVDVEWVMRSLGQTPTQKQIEAIIRDMDLDNDGVIDLAEFMIRMMALTTKVSLAVIAYNTANAQELMLQPPAKGPTCSL